MVSAVAYLHEKGIAHLDLKLENLMIGKDFQLKIIDFDMSYKEGDKKVISLGTRYYRAPELVMDLCVNPRAADIFSAGIILFVFKCSGKIPQMEDTLYHGVNLFELMQTNREKFWDTHTQAQERDPDFFEADFKELFMRMTDCAPENRPTISEIKQMNWYKREIYTDEQVISIMKPYYLDIENK